MFLGKGVLKICSKFTGKHPCQCAISIKLQSNFIEMTIRHGFFPVHLLQIFRTPFSKNTSGRLLLKKGINVSKNIPHINVMTSYVELYDKQNKPLFFREILFTFRIYFAFTKRTALFYENR